MKRNLDTVMYMPDMQTPMTFGDSHTPLTAGMMIAEATIAMYPDEQPRPDGNEKKMRFGLSLRCGLGGEQEFTKAELDCILRCTNMKCGTWLYGQMEAWSRGAAAFDPVVDEDAEDALDVAEAHIEDAA